MEIPLKRKYTVAMKTRFGSSHNDGQRKLPRRRKTGKADVLPGVRTMVLANNKIRMEWR